MERRPVLPLEALPAAWCPAAAVRLLEGDGPAGAENKDDERSLALESEGTSQGSLTGLGAGSFFRKPLWVGPWYSSSLGIVLFEQPGVVLLK